MDWKLPCLRNSAGICLQNQRIMIMATDAGIAIIVAMALYMCVRTTKEIREIRSLS